MEESKFYKPPKEPKVAPKKIEKWINKVLMTALLTILLLIGFKIDHGFKEQFNKYVYNSSFPFAKVKEFYQSHFGESLALKKITGEEQVFSEKLQYDKKSLYKDGASLSVADNYMVPSLNSGIVVFIGEKDDYHNTVIVQQMDGVDVWYGNIDTVSVKLYDYIEKGSLIGQVKEKTLYMAFQKEGKFVDYKSYLE